MAKRITIDWKTFAGFAGLLLLIMIVGLIGIRQIQNLSKVVTRLAKLDIPLQNSVLEMKSSNNKYAMGIRSYMYWRSAKFLESAAVGEKLNLVRKASSDFDRNLEFYASSIQTPEQMEWVQTIRLSEAQLRSIGETIIGLIDRVNTASKEERPVLETAINRQMMVFENTLFQIDAFLENPVQSYNLSSIDEQLAVAEAGRRNSVIFLSWSLLVGLLLGSQTAYLIYRRGVKEREHREMLWRTVIRVEEEERNNLSLQIHDQMGQDLSALKIYLGLISSDISGGDNEIKERIEKAKKILDTLMSKAHDISQMLRPPELDDIGIVESIAALVLHYREMTSINYNFIKPVSETKLSSESSLVLYRIIQEALTNIIKHSNAKNVEVSLQVAEGEVYLWISDDGIGFDYSLYTHKHGRRREDKLRLGLSGLRERVEVLGGKFLIDSKPGSGTKLKVILPIC